MANTPYAKFTNEQLEKRYKIYRTIWRWTWRVCLGIAAFLHLCLLMGCIEVGGLMVMNGTAVPWAAFADAQMRPVPVDLALGIVVFFA